MTLAETVKTFRRGARLIGVGAVLLLGGRILFGTIPFSFFNGGPKPTPTPAPQVGFGQLPPLEIDSLAPTSFSTTTFTLDLINTLLPQEPVLADVYQIPESTLGLLTQEKAQAIAATFDFDQFPDLAGDYYSWKVNDRQLRVEKQTLHVFYSYNYAAHPEIFIPGSFYSTSQTIDLAKKILNEHKASWGLEESKPSYKLLKLEGGRLQYTQSLRDASAARVDFPRPSTDSYDLMTTNPDLALVYVVFAANPESSRSPGALLELQRVYWPVSTEEPSTYTLKTSQQAWDELVAERQHLVKVLPRGGDPTAAASAPRVSEFRARNAYLAYFYPPDYQEYLQPIWVFEGQAILIGLQHADWTAYVPAVSESFIQ